jgi:hypothetical protein
MTLFLKNSKDAKSIYQFYTSAIPDDSKLRPLVMGYLAKNIKRSEFIS